MSIATLGNGKTGGQVIELLGGYDVEIFNTRNKPTVESLAKHEVGICFFSGEVFEGYIDMLVEAGLPMIIGSTGFAWPSDINKQLISKGISWIHGNNFSLGMNIIKGMIETLSQAPQLVGDHSFTMHETHHAQKKDAPSGTAKSWEEWLDRPVDITSDRIGDVVGEHTLTLDTPFETIQLKHSAKSRQLFAQGAVWAAKELIKGAPAPGLHTFQDFVQISLTKEYSYEP